MLEMYVKVIRKLSVQKCMGKEHFDEVREKGKPPHMEGRQ